MRSVKATLIGSLTKSPFIIPTVRAKRPFAPPIITAQTVMLLRTVHTRSAKQWRVPPLKYWTITVKKRPAAKSVRSVFSAAAYRRDISATGRKKTKPLSLSTTAGECIAATRCRALYSAIPTFIRRRWCPIPTAATFLIWLPTLFPKMTALT